MLLVIETDRRTKEQSYHFGIIDILQKWNWSKKLENAWKTCVMRANKNKLSAVPTGHYQKRFEKFMESIVFTKKGDKVLRAKERAEFI